MIKLLNNKSKIKINYIDKNQNLKKIPSQKINIDKILREIKYKPKIKLRDYLLRKYYEELKIFKK